MRKLLLYLLLFIPMLTGCDPVTTFDYMLSNRTKSDLTIKIDDRGKQSVLIIHSGETKLILSDGGFDGYRGVQERPNHDGAEEEFVISASMTVDGKSVSKDIWKRKYWGFKGEVHHAKYTLVVTEDLLQSLETEIGIDPELP